MPKKADGSSGSSRMPKVPLADELFAKVSDLHASVERAHDRADQLHKRAEQLHRDAQEVRQAARQINEEHQRQQTNTRTQRPDKKKRAL
jgi:prefoldin subunit 5